MNPQGSVILEIFGEGKTDIGQETQPQPPSTGVVPILVHKLCGKPQQMLVKRRAYQFLHGKSFWQKVWFAKRQAFYNRSAGVVFVVDSEGDRKDLEAKQGELRRGRDAGLSDYPFAAGVAHPCIEAWLLADGSAIRRALQLASTPATPEVPEDLPAPGHDRRHNPKTVLASLVASGRRDLSSEEKDQIARAMNDLVEVGKRCVLGFAPFASQVNSQIRPLFTGGG